jgi:hypothetical protein
MKFPVRGSLLFLILFAAITIGRTTADAEFVYTVRPGDRFSDIVVQVLKLQDPSRWKVFGKAVAEYNGLADIDLIRPGQKVRFPAIKIAHPDRTDLKTLVKEYFGGNWDRRSDIVIHRTDVYLVILRDLRFLSSGSF